MNTLSLTNKAILTTQGKLVYYSKPITGLLAIAMLLTANAVLAVDSSQIDPPELLTLRESARNGDIDAKYRLALLYESGGSGLKKSYSEAAARLYEAATAGHTLAQRKLAMMHLKGRGVPQSYEEAQRWYFQASQKNDTPSQYHLGMILLTGQGGQMSVETATEWFRKAAESNHKGAQLELGRLYLTGKHVSKNVDVGLKWVKRAADQDYAPAMFLLAQLYEEGQVVTEDPEQSLSYYTRAAESGHPDSQVWMGSWYERQEPPQYAKAFSVYKKAAKRGSAAGHFGVARMHLERLIRATNSDEGLRHLRQAASLNFPEAHYTMGIMYGKGSLSGGSKKALEHFQVAANLKHTPAMYQLAFAYYQGTPPLKKNIRKAAQWWRAAASAGHVDSQYAFSLLYLKGNGVPKNRGVAFALANIAAAQGHNDAAKVRDELHASLTPDTLRKAQDLSVDLFKQYVTDSKDNNYFDALLK